MAIQDQVAAAKGAIDALIGDPDASVEEIGAALASINDHIIVNWKRSHRIRQAEANAVEPTAEG